MQSILGLLVFVLFLGACNALLEESIVSFGPAPAAVDIASAPILYGDDDFKGVHIAVESLAQDLQEITGISRETHRLSDDAPASELAINIAIIAGSSNSTLIQNLSREGTIDISDLDGKWESFRTEVVQNPLPGVASALVIIGSDKRGTIFGIHTLAEQSGQSPYHWFADVPAKKHANIYAMSKSTFHGEPSVKYRGLFINDEEPALTTWWSALHNETHHPLDSEFYAHVFDLLLRLKANYLWPAMWKSFTPPPGNMFFVDDPKNQQLADDYGIVISTAHHEPMQRATNEWDEAESGPWNWEINKENMTEFMEEGIIRAGKNESYFTIGLRGLGDAAINTENAIEALKDVFATQRQLIAKHYGAEDAVSQVWALYKEVASYYDAGLDAPDDVTLLFPDDNQGNLYRLPTGDEASRLGGTGVYFHFEYVGLPRSYKWANTNNLPKVLKELSHAHLRGANQIWIMNVGDIKPMELPLAFTMDLAWNASSITFETIPQYLRLYAAREFGDEYADDIAEIWLEQSHLLGMRRLEHITPGTFSTTNYGEAETILHRWQALSDRATAVHEGIDDEKLKAAFFQLVYYPVVSATTFHAVAIGIGTNYRYGLERRNSANALATRVLDLFEADFDLHEAWDDMLGGKWRHMMSQAKYDAVGQEPKNWAGPSRDLVANLSFVQLRQNMQFSQGNLGIWAEGSDNAIQQGRWAESVDASMPTVDYAPVLPEMSPYGPETRHVDLFMRGDIRQPISFTIEDPLFPWISVNPREGTLDRDHMDQRLNITVDWENVPSGFNETVTIGVTSTPSPYPYFDLIRVPILNHAVPVGFSGFPETAGYISIEAPHFQRASWQSDDQPDREGVLAFETFPHLGTRTESGAIAVRPFETARQGDAGSAWVQYDFYLFDPSDAVEATVYINAGLDTDPKLKMEFSLTVDDTAANFTRVLGDYITNPYAGDIPPEWMDHVADQVWTKTVSLGSLVAGEHSLQWRVNSPEIYLEKIILDIRGSLKESYLGPPQTSLV